LYTPQIENGFETVLSKIRKGNLSKEERLQARVNETIQVELTMIESMSFKENQWVEGWKPESLAFRYFNILQMYRIKYEVALFLHQEIMDTKKVFSDDRLQHFEWTELGFDLTKVYT